jgi:hypothetical protein
MTANMEWELLSRIVKTANLKEVLDWGVRSQDYGITQARAMYDILLSTYIQQSSAGSVLGLHSVGKVFPDFQPRGDDSVTTEFLCQQVREGYIERALKTAAEKAVEDCGTSVSDALADIVSTTRQLIELGTFRNSDSGMADGLGRLVNDYELEELGLKKPKFDWPWPIMNEMTGGVSDEDYIILYGRPKQKKSWGLAYMVAHALSQDMRVLVYTKEMKPENLRRRIVACGLKLPYHEFRRGRLRPDQKAALYDYKAFYEDPSTRGNVVMLDGGEVQGGGDTVAWLSAKVDKYQPDVLFIDGLALLSDDSKRQQPDHMRVQGISRALRQLGIRKKIPIIATIHANRKASGHTEGNLDEIAYSDAVAQDATVAIRMVADMTRPVIAMVMAGSREFYLPGFRINSVLAQDFTQHSVMEPEEVQKMSEAEQRGQAAKKKKTGQTKTADSDTVPVEGLTEEAQELIAKQWNSMRFRS